tara:strand:+ start:683 stop:1192 length:510 start_codon:yes stop_codon:yes gene_type:complete
MSGIVGRGSGLWGKSGLVTEEFRNPDQPSFRAARDSNYSHTAEDRIVYNTAGGGYRFNIGGHFNTSTGQFTAPITGCYLINAQVIWMGIGNNTNMIDSIRLKISGTTMAYGNRRAFYTEDSTGDGGYFVEAINTIVRVSANDTIEVLGQKTQQVHGNSEYTRFEGYLLG